MNGEVGRVLIAAGVALVLLAGCREGEADAPPQPAEGFVLATPAPARIPAAAGPDPATLGLKAGANPRIVCTALDNRIRNLGFAFSGGDAPKGFSGPDLVCKWSKETTTSFSLGMFTSTVEGLSESEYQVARHAPQPSPSVAPEELPIGDKGFLTAGQVADRQNLVGGFVKGDVYFHAEYSSTETQADALKSFSALMSALSQNTGAIPTLEDKLLALNDTDRTADALKSHPAFASVKKIDPTRLDSSGDPAFCRRLDAFVLERFELIPEDPGVRLGESTECAWAFNKKPPDDRYDDGDRLWELKFRVTKVPDFVVGTYAAIFTNDLKPLRESTRTFSEFPVGDEGHIIHTTYGGTGSADGTARVGDYLVDVSVGGYIYHRDPERRSITEQTAYETIAELVNALPR